MFGNGLGEVNNPPDNDKYFKLVSADVVVPRMDAWRLLWDFRTIRDLAKSLPETSPLGNKCMEAGNSIMNVFKADDLSSIAKARKVAEKVRPNSLRRVQGTQADDAVGLWRRMGEDWCRNLQGRPRRLCDLGDRFVHPHLAPSLLIRLLLAQETATSTQPGSGPTRLRSRRRRAPGRLRSIS